METQALIDQAMALPLEERVRLAEALWESIDEGLVDHGERQAIDDAMRRDAELTSGAAVGRSHEEVMHAVRRALGCD